ncbi:MAG: nucleoside kinase [Muribaculaceae bacterium]|nr:nucleoside kinase [Muribaculaceae bacterium]
MGAPIKIFCKNCNEYISVNGGDSLADLIDRLDCSFDFSPICALVNNKIEPLSFQIFGPKQIEFIRPDSVIGKRVYIRSLCMMLYRALVSLFPDYSLRIEHSVSKGYFCRLFDEKGNCILPTRETIDSLLYEMHTLHTRNLPFERKEKLSEDVRDIFSRQKLYDKVLLLETTQEIYTTYYVLDGIADSYYGPLAPSTANIGVFDLRLYKDGMLLLGEDSENPGLPVAPITQEKMFKAFTDYLKFNRVIGVANVGELNKAVQQKRTSSLINVAEALHDKLLGRISDEITRRYENGGARVILIAGPSSSGKTTSTKRLAIQLMTNLLTPKMISLDDYFVNREDTPLDENGEYDYESLYSLDLERLNADLGRLLRGEEINLPTYSFEHGCRIEKKRPLRLNPNEVLLIEGIHGLNPELTRTLDPDSIYKVYVSALTTLSIDDHNWISTTDTRLLRRIVRDSKYRHTTALESLRRWSSVRRGEEKWIFPFQENADATFNSSLIFELGVMKDYVEPLLREVPHNDEQYVQAYRLLRLLSYFHSIPAEQIPTTSLLREFLGGSSFHY